MDIITVESIKLALWLNADSDHNISEIAGIFTLDWHETLGEFHTTISSKNNIDFADALNMLSVYSKTNFHKRLDELIFCSWGFYESVYILAACEDNNVRYPFSIGSVLSRNFASKFKIKPPSLKEAHAFLDMRYEEGNALVKVKCIKNIMGACRGDS